jgi:hypothetical protein
MLGLSWYGQARLTQNRWCGLLNRIEVIMNLVERIKVIERKYQDGQNLYRRSSVALLLERISQLEAAQQSFAHDVPNESAKVVKCMHGYVPEWCSICSARV